MVNQTCNSSDGILNFFFSNFAPNSSDFHYHRFRWYATFENKTPAEIFPKFLSVVRVIDRSDGKPPIAASSVIFYPSLRHGIGVWLVDFDPTCLTSFSITRSTEENTSWKVYTR